MIADRRQFWLIYLLVFAVIGGILYPLTNNNDALVGWFLLGSCVLNTSVHTKNAVAMLFSL